MTTTVTLARENAMRRGLFLAATAVVALGTSLTANIATSSTPAAASVSQLKLPGGFKHLVVIYLENHSFDNLYGGWGSVDGQPVDGLGAATGVQSQVAQDGTTFSCLFQNDPNLAGAQPADCNDSHQVTGAATAGFASHFPNAPFSIDDYLSPTDTTCPKAGQSTTLGVLNGTGDPGGCTRDLVHRFYQEQYALDGGKQDRYVTGSDAAGLAMGHYDTQQLPVYKYLHSKGAPNYVIADHFFQAAFGGSFLNHQWLIAARTPYDAPGGIVPTGANRARPSTLDSAGMPSGLKYPLYNGSGASGDFEDTVACPSGGPTDLVSQYQQACGPWAVNTVQPASPPNNLNTATPGRALPLIDDNVYPNIGDELSAAGVSWNWYSGGWNDAVNGQTGRLFQYHHQPFNYFANYAPGQPGRDHLRDESEFETAAQNGTLPTVSFVKPYGDENEHPGYASEPTGSDHLVQLLEDITDGASAGNTLVVVTYDEFGGQWDHVAPPSGPTAGGTADKWGPGTRIPAMIIGRSLTRSGVDHTTYDTTSILATIEHSFGLDNLSTRDEAVNDLTNAVRVGGR